LEEHKQIFQTSRRYPQTIPRFHTKSIRHKGILQYKKMIFQLRVDHTSHTQRFIQQIKNSETSQVSPSWKRDKLNSPRNVSIDTRTTPPIHRRHHKEQLNYSHQISESFSHSNKLLQPN